jgi:hypothetical protein
MAAAAAGGGEAREEEEEEEEEAVVEAVEAMAERDLATTAEFLAIWLATAQIRKRTAGVAAVVAALATTAVTPAISLATAKQRTRKGRIFLDRIKKSVLSVSPSPLACCSPLDLLFPSLMENVKTGFLNLVLAVSTTVSVIRSMSLALGMHLCLSLSLLPSFCPRFLHGYIFPFLNLVTRIELQWFVLFLAMEGDGN